MKTLSSIGQDIATKARFGPEDPAIRQVQFDSRKVGAGDVFVAVKGHQTDGHAYIAKALELGAAVVVCQEMPTDFPADKTCWVVENSAKALGQMASNFYGRPSERLKVVAVTGTNGKTTTATLLYTLFLRLGYGVGLLSTIENKINDRVLPASLTTPDPLTTHRLMAEMLEEGCTHCFMEASSHAIHQDRIAGIHLTGALFTNITHDHLDYHVTFANYIAAKKKLFDELPASAFALVNADDKRGPVMLQNCVGNTYTFALRQMADFKGRLIDNTFDGLLMEVDNRQVWFRLIGDFNAYNLMGIYGAAVLLGEESELVLTELSGIQPAKGRFDQIISPSGIRAVVDYAHTPDALQNVLETIQGIRKPNERIITVVGCGGDRDRTKRPKMAAIAAKLSDKVVLTSDNPRSEDPDAIIAEMKTGLDLQGLIRTISIANRREAIHAACLMATPGDIVLVAGKGHEDYQEIKGVKHPFDDRKVVEEYLQT